MALLQELLFMKMMFCSIAPNVHSVVSQSSEINSFATNVGLKLNASKLEVVQI